jgi:lipoprotein-releasing system permease protein
MKLNWIWFIATRYIFRKQKKSPSPVLSIVGIATGVFALIVIIAVMNGFQLSFIESILEISSYHLRLGNLPAGPFTEQSDGAGRTRAELLAIPGIEAVVPFQEFKGLIRGNRGGQQAVNVRGLTADAPSLDPAMAARLEFESGSFDLGDGRNVLLGAELARRIGVRDGDEVTLFSIPAIFSGGDDDEAGRRTFTVTGIFRTGFYEYDTGWAFITIENAGAFSDTGPVWGIKLKNRFHDQKTRELIKHSPVDTGEADISTWRDYNRSFFGALRTEKLFMFILVGLIFIVVGLNIYQAQRRAVLEHREDIGLLRAIGGGERAVQMIFVCDGAIIGFTGAAIGLALGLLVALHIPLFFTIIEKMVNGVIDLVNIIAGFMNADVVDGFAFFSPAVFYIKEIPSRVIPQEVVMIFMFGFCAALLAAWFASRAISRILVAEVLRYE